MRSPIAACISAIRSMINSVVVFKTKVRMGRGDDIGRPGCRRYLQHGERGLESFGAVVDAKDDVAVNVDQGSETSDLRVEIKECVQRLHQLPLDFFFTAALDEMQRNGRGIAVFKFDFRFFESFQFVGRQKPQAVDQSKLRHQMNISSS